MHAHGGDHHPQLRHIDANGLHDVALALFVEVRNAERHEVADQPCHHSDLDGLAQSLQDAEVEVVEQVCRDLEAQQGGARHPDDRPLPQMVCDGGGQVRTVGAPRIEGPRQKPLHRQQRQDGGHASSDGRQEEPDDQARESLEQGADVTPSLHLQKLQDGLAVRGALGQARGRPSWPGSRHGAREEPRSDRSQRVDVDTHGRARPPATGGIRDPPQGLIPDAKQRDLGIHGRRDEVRSGPVVVLVRLRE